MSPGCSQARDREGASDAPSSLFPHPGCSNREGACDASCSSHHPWEPPGAAQSPSCAAIPSTGCMPRLQAGQRSGCCFCERLSVPAVSPL